MIINPISTNIKTSFDLNNKRDTYPNISKSPINDEFIKSSSKSSIITNSNKPSNISFQGYNIPYEEYIEHSLPKSLKAKVKSARSAVIKKFENKFESITFKEDIFNPDEEYILFVKLNENKGYIETYDKNINKIGKEDAYIYTSPKSGKKYVIRKGIDYVHNTITKIREEIIGENNTALINEVRIIKNKKNEVVKKELLTLSPIEGAYNQKYVYPNKTEEIVSEVHQYKNDDNMKCIYKNLKSLDGTKSQYRFEQDDKGNKILEYKIIDKNGKILMNLNKTMEKVSDNKFVSTNGDKIYETTFLPNKLIITENNGKITTIPLKSKMRIWNIFSKGIFVKGNTDEIINLLKNMPAEQILALSKTAKALYWVNDINNCNLSIYTKFIHTINETFTALHEVGHALDYKKANVIFNHLTQISCNSELRKIYTEERKAFTKAYPRLQRLHIRYFIAQKEHYSGSKWGGLEEVVAEINALRNAYTTTGILGARVQYLQQYYPRTIAYTNKLLEKYNG